MWSIEDGLRSMGCIELSMQYEVCNVEYTVWSMECGVWNIDYKVWNVDEGA